MALSSYLAGNRVYRGGSNAPTRGTVDPMGYIDRELNNMASQRRSGLASAALSRLGRQRTAPTGPRGQSQQALDLAKNPQQGLAGIGGGGGQQAPRGGPLNMTNTGKLQPSVGLGAGRGGSQLPYDPAAAEDQVALESSKADFENSAIQDQSRIEQEYLTQKRGVEEQRPELMRNLLEGFAGRGMAYSSGYQNEQGELNNEFKRLFDELDSGKSEGLGALGSRREEFDRAYRGRNAEIAAAAARRLAEQAGDLGLGGQEEPGLMGEAPAPAPERLSDTTQLPGIMSNPSTLAPPVTVPRGRQGARTPAPAPKIAAPKLGTAGNVTIGGKSYHVNTRGIIDTRGPNYGKYPAQVR